MPETCENADTGDTQNYFKGLPSEAWLQSDTYRLFFIKERVFSKLPAWRSRVQRINIVRLRMGLHYSVYTQTTLNQDWLGGLCLYYQKLLTTCAELQMARATDIRLCTCGVVYMLHRHQH